MNAFELSLRELEEWGVAFARAQHRPCLITLTGDLGTGKTTLARALCRGFGVRDIDAVTSPTFAILQEYDATNFVVTHADLYRLNTEAELDMLGWDEIIENAQVAIVEWPERTSRGWPATAIHIQLDYGTGDNLTRGITVTR